MRKYKLFKLVINEDNICINNYNNDDEYYCKEQILCLKFKSNNTNDYNKLTASSPNKKCLSNPDHTEWNSSHRKIFLYYKKWY